MEYTELRDFSHAELIETGVPGPPGPPGDVASAVIHDGTPGVADWLKVKSVNPLVVERAAAPSSAAPANMVTTDTVQTITGQKTFTAATATTVGLIVQGAVGQTANFQEWRNSAGEVVARLAPDFLALGDKSKSWGFTLSVASRGVLATFAASHAQLANEVGFSYGDHSMYPYSHYITGSRNVPANPKNEVLRIAASRPVEVPLTLRAAVAQTGDFLQLQDSAGAVVAAVAPTGGLRARNIEMSVGSITVAGEHKLTMLTRDNIGWEVNTGGGAVDINPSPYARQMRFYSGITQGLIFRTSTRIGGEHAAAEVPLIVKGVAAQTADLLQAQDSAGVIQSLISPTGEYENVGAGRGIILRSPNGTRYRITVSDAGALAAVAA